MKQRGAVLATETWLQTQNHGAQMGPWRCKEVLRGECQDNPQNKGAVQACARQQQSVYYMQCLPAAGMCSVIVAPMRCTFMACLIRNIDRIAKQSLQILRCLHGVLLLASGASRRFSAKRIAATLSTARRANRYRAIDLIFGTLAPSTAPVSQPSGPSNLGCQRPPSPTTPPTSPPAIPAKGTAWRGTPYAARAPPQLRLCQPQIRFWPARSKAVRRLHARFLPHNQSNIAHLVKSRSKTGLDLANSKGLTTEKRASEDTVACTRLAVAQSPVSVSVAVCTYRIASPRIVIASVSVSLSSPAFGAPRPPGAPRRSLHKTMLR